MIHAALETSHDCAMHPSFSANDPNSKGGVVIVLAISKTKFLTPVGVNILTRRAPEGGEGVGCVWGLFLV